MRHLALALLLAAPIASSADDPAQFEAAKRAVIARLKDPDSAQFRNLRIGKGDIVCGEVNARNSYGGMTGFQPFFATAESADIVTGDGDGAEARLRDRVYRTACEN